MVFVSSFAVDRSLVRSLFLGLSVCVVVLAQPNRATALPTNDPIPPMGWDDLIACESVVVGRYESHKNDVLTIRVLRVLRSEHTQSNDLVSVTLKHWYSVETDLSRFGNVTSGKKKSNVPILCYYPKSGNLMSWFGGEAIPDVHEPAIYFFPKAKTPTLERQRQVQPGVQVENWRQALEGKPTPLIFRLGQPRGERIQREAIEELFETRDKATIRELYDWAAHPSQGLKAYDVPDMFAAIGDKNGDVYDRGSELLTQPRQGAEKGSYFSLAAILARVAPDRAVDDFRRILAGDSPELKEAVRSAVGSARSEKALDLAFELLADKPEGHPEALSGLLDGPQDSVGKRLRASAQPRLAKAIDEARLSRSQKQELREQWQLQQVLDKPPTAAELAAAEGQLLHPTAGVSADEEEADKALAVIVRGSDPRSIPTLVKLLRAHGGDGPGGNFAETIVHFANICPQAMRRELVKQGVEAGFGKETRMGEHYIYHEVMVASGNPHTLEDLVGVMGRRGQEGWLEKHGVPPEVHEELVSEAGTYSLSFRTLEISSRVKPADTALCLDKAYAQRDQFKPVGKCELLGMEVKFGRAALTNELLESARQALAGKLTLEDQLELADILLKSGDKGAYRIFLQIVDELGPTMYEHEHASLLATMRRISFIACKRCSNLHRCRCGTWENRRSSCVLIGISGLMRAIWPGRGRRSCARSSRCWNGTRRRRRRKGGWIS